MLTDFSAFAPGAPWPVEDADTIDRLKRCTTNKLLFDNRADEVFDTWIKLATYDGSAELQILLNWHKLTSVKFADLLFGEPPDVESENETAQDELAALLDRVGMWRMSHMVAIDAGRYGTGVYKPRRRDDAAHLGLADPIRWYPVVEPDDVQDVQAHIVATPWKSDPEINEDDRLTVEQHDRGSVTTTVYMLESNEIGSVVEGPTIENMRADFGIEGFLLAPAHNVMSSDAAWGIDDYEQVDGVMQEMMVRYDLIARILNKHASPKLVVPRSAMEQDSEGRAILRAARDAIIETEGERGVTRYVTWEAQLAACYAQLDRLKEQAHMLLETSPALFGISTDGAAESGTARRIRLQTTLAKVARLRANFDPVVKDVIRNLAALEGMEDLGALTLHWHDGLPDDMAEMAEVEALRVTAGITSKRSAIRRLDGMDDEAVDKELAEIDTEAAASAPPSPVVTLPEA